jgi:hypothetical protein
VKRSTAISRLRDVVDGLNRAAEWPTTTVVAAYVHGVLLTGVDELDWVELAFVVDEPVESVSWRVRPAHLEALADELRFSRLPLSWVWRPAAWPVWNHAIERATRVWNRGAGGDASAFAALAAGQLDGVTVDRPPSRDALRARVAVERDVAREHLAETIESFYDRDWRRTHQGGGVHSEDHLWWAAAGFMELDTALGELSHG